MDIREITSYVISLRTQNDRRREGVASLMAEIGVRDWSFFDAFDVRGRPLPDFYGCGFSRREALLRADYPCVIYEDDVVRTDWFRPVVEVPDDRIVYLGNSVWGTRGKTTGWPGGVTLTEVGGEEYVKVEEMLAHHAVYYPDRAAALAYSAPTIRHMLESNAPSDIALARQQRETDVYCLRRPLFCQDGHNRRWTHVEADPARWEEIVQACLETPD